MASPDMHDTPRKHAPKGPLFNKRDPIGPPDPMESRCKATNRKGQRCGKPHIPGGTVCRMHGGAAPQVKQAAMARLMALQQPAITRIGQLIEQTAFPTVSYAASRDVLDRTMGKPAETVAVDHSGEVIFRWKGE